VFAMSCLIFFRNSTPFCKDNISPPTARSMVAVLTITGENQPKIARSSQKFASRPCPSRYAVINIMLVENPLFALEKKHQNSIPTHKQASEYSIVNKKIDIKITNTFDALLLAKIYISAEIRGLKKRQHLIMYMIQ
jgi:hypothetical protein